MARRAKMQLAFTKGVLDKGLSERIDLVHYYQSVRTGLNFEFLAQGGFRRRAGTALAYPLRQRRRIEPVPIDALSITAHNGGTTANLVDQDDTTLFTTTLAPGGADFIVAEVDLGDTVTLAFVDVEGFRSAANRVDDALGVEWWDGSTWQAIRGPEVLSLSSRATVRTSARTRRFGEAPGNVVTTRYVRVVIYGGAGLGAISVAGLRVWAEQSAIPGAVRAIPFAKSASEVYQLVQGDCNIDVFDNGAYLASIPLPAMPWELVDEINIEQSQDTLFLFHEDCQTPRITRQGSGDEWQVDVVPYANVPALTNSTAFSGNQDEVQSIALEGFAGGQRLALLFGGRLAPVWTSTIAADLPAQIIAALGDLSGVTGADITATLTSSAPATVEIKFHGDNGERAWPRIAIRSLGSSAVSALSTVVRRGLAAGGAIIAAETGWPRAGAIYQARLIVGGMRAAPQTLLFSRTGSFYDFQITAGTITADLGIMHTLDTDAVETIEDIFIGRHLQVFTEQGEWWSDNRTIDATQAVNMIVASRYGIERAVPLVFAENASLFLEKGGRVVRDFLYSDASTSYEAEALSLLAPHLVTGARSMAYRRAPDTAEANHLTVVNESGRIALLCLLRKQEVIAWADWRTHADDGVREVMTDALDRVWYIVERAGDLWLEKRDTTALTDGTVDVEAIGLGTVTGLPAFMEGRTVWALAEGDVLGPFAVTGGATNIGIATELARIGLDFATDAEGMDAREQLSAAQPFRPPGRIYEAELALANTGYVEFGANGSEPEEVPLRHLDGEVDDSVATGDEPENDLLDVPLMERLYTGKAVIEGLEGWTETMRWRIRQTRPAPLEVRSLRLEIAMRG